MLSVLQSFVEIGQVGRADQAEYYLHYDPVTGREEDVRVKVRRHSKWKLFMPYAHWTRCPAQREKMEPGPILLLVA